MPDQIELPRPQPHPLLTLKSAVVWARAAGHRVRLGGSPWGVHCVSSHGLIRWEVDPRTWAMDPVGAAILLKQPEATDPFAAAAEALSAPESWIAGLVDVLDGEPEERRWSESIHRACYSAGREAGYIYRHDFLGGRPETPL